MKPDGREMLCEEAKYIYHCIFRRLPSDDLVKAYVRAHSEIDDLSAIDEGQLRTVRSIVERCLDTVGIEPWLRKNGMRHALSAKMLLLAYLAECDGHHSEFMRRAASGRVPLASMGRVTFWAMFRLLRGYVQKVWYGLF